MIGHLADEKAARTFADYLYVQKIESHLDYEKPDGWGIWVNDEDKIEEAARLLTAFRANPADPKYRAEAKSAAELRAEAEKGEASLSQEGARPAAALPAVDRLRIWAADLWAHCDQRHRGHSTPGSVMTPRPIMRPVHHRLHGDRQLSSWSKPCRKSSTANCGGWSRPSSSTSASSTSSSTCCGCAIWAA